MNRKHEPTDGSEDNWAIKAIREALSAAQAGRERPLSAVIADKRARFSLPNPPQDEEGIRQAGNLE